MEGIEVEGRRIGVALNPDLSMTVRDREGRIVWESSRTHAPRLVVSVGRCFHEVPLAAAGAVSAESFRDGPYRGRQWRLSGYDRADVCLELAIGIDAETDEILVTVEPVGGTDAVWAVRDLYRFEKPTADGGYMLLPHGSGYLIPADCPDELPGAGPTGGFIGARWSMPLFGMVRGNDGLCAMVETWWDCDVNAEHAPGGASAFGLDWEPSLGRLAYPRRLLLRVAEGMDYVEMARVYREHARSQGLVRPLEEKAEQTPILREYVRNVLYRWAAWNPDEGDAVLQDVRRLQADGLGINFFYPKWSPAGYSPEEGAPTTATAGWQAFLHPTPVPGGWPTLVELENQLHDLGCVVQGFVCPISQVPEGVQFDEDRCPVDAAGVRHGHPVSCHDAPDRMADVYDSLERAGLKLDVLYHDGFSAHVDLPQDFALSHPMSRRQNLEAEVACFDEARRRGVVPGAELARFWSIGACDYFFFTDWSSDRLANTPTQHAPAPVGEPVPVFQLVFHDCFIAGFSGGGYTAYSAGYDWWDHRTPRLYELMHAAAPAYNWLPDPVVPLANWETEENKRVWLKQWSQYYRTIAMSPMVSHQLLTPDRTQQQVEFATGVAGEFNMAENRFRITGVAGLDEEWQTPPSL